MEAADNAELEQVLGEAPRHEEVGLRPENFIFNVLHVGIWCSDVP